MIQKVSPLNDVPNDISALLQSGSEQEEVVGPLASYLQDLGWSLDQLVFGKKEWRVPKRPSEASNREKNRSFEGFPVDIAVFDSTENRGDPAHCLILFECKAPDEEAGVDQLETYMSLEPNVKLGVWSNHADPSAPVVFLFRTGSGKIEFRRRPLQDMPRPGDPIDPKTTRIGYSDLTTPSSGALQKVVEDILDHVVVNDSRVTRREEQLDQICDLLLLKLDSDKAAKASTSTPPTFRTRSSSAQTASTIRDSFRRLVKVYPEVFREEKDKELRLADDTLHRAVELLEPYKLIDVGVSAISTAFQTLRTEALKQGEGQYFTPQPIIEAGIELLDIKWGDLVIDPACGTGGFLVEALMSMQRKHPDSSDEIARWAQKHIYGIEKDAIGVKLTKAIMQIAGDGSANCVRGDSVRTFQWPSKYPELNSGQFAPGRFSVVVTNPPFGSKLKVSASDCRKSNLDIAIRTKKQEYKKTEIGLIFLQRAHQLLEMDGRLGIVLPESYFFSTSYQYIFEWMDGKLKPEVVLNVPMEAFQGFCRAKTNFYVFRKVGE